VTGPVKPLIDALTSCKATANNGAETTLDIETTYQKTSIKQIRDALTRIPNLFTNNKKLNPNITKILSQEIKDSIAIEFPNLKTSVAIHCIINSIVVPCCKICGNPVRYFNSSTKTFSEHCSIQCSRKDNTSKTKRAETKLKKYGDAVYNNRSLAKETCLYRYGVDNAVHLEETKQKISSTLKSKSEELKSARHKTFDEKYGCHPQKTQSVKQKKRQRTLSKYGVEHSTQLASVIEKIQNSKDKNYQAQYQYVIDHIKNKEKPALRTALAKETNVSLAVITNITDRYQLPFKEVKIGTSVGELEIKQFLEDNGIETIHRDRCVLNGVELDLYMPHHNLAIEFNGVYWHTEQHGKNKNYHLNKTVLCEEKGIQLLHIWDTEWNDLIKNSIWKSMILSRLGIHQEVIGARNTTFRPVQKSTAKVFLDQNHLSGTVGSSDQYGLFYQDELVLLATYGKSRFSKNVNTELLRLCSKKGMQITGGASKIFKHQPHNSFVTYANRRYSVGGVYHKTNLKFLHTTSPNYWYIVNGRMQNRIQYQKHKLQQQIQFFDAKLTESQNMNNNGLYRIWDSGNLTFIYQKNSRQ